MENYTIFINNDRFMDLEIPNIKGDFCCRDNSDIKYDKCNDCIQCGFIEYKSSSLYGNFSI